MDAIISENGLVSPYHFGDVVTVLEPIMNPLGLLARPGDLGCVVIAEGIRYTVGEQVHEWVCGIYINGHGSIGVEAEKIRLATAEEADRFWNEQRDIVRGDRSLLDNASSVIAEQAKTIESLKRQVQSAEKRAAYWQTRAGFKPND